MGGCLATKIRSLLCDVVRSLQLKSFRKYFNIFFYIHLRMLCYITGLTPHKIQDTISINEARRLIINLSKPLALVAKNIDDNLRIIGRQQTLLADKNKTIEELKQLLHFDMLRIEVVKIPHPKTVCTHTDCTEVLVVSTFTSINSRDITFNLLSIIFRFKAPSTSITNKSVTIAAILRIYRNK